MKKKLNVISQVKTPFNFSDPNVKVIEFADYEPEANTMMTVSGWGTLWVMIIFN